MRNKIIAGNWKMNMTESEAVTLIDSLKNDCNVSGDTVIFFVPFTDIKTCVEKLKDTNIKIGAQNFYYEDKGAYTGEVSASMLKDSGVKYVIIGHSERRTIFKEDDQMINKKVVAAFKNELTPIVCCGEALEIREKNEYLTFIEKQIISVFKNIDKENAKKAIIAYEPIWAIGTGKTATSDEAEEVCGKIRDIIGNLYDDDTKIKIHILYGGSVKSSNAKELFTKPNIDGGLVGGASLTTDFINIVNYK